MGDIRFNFVEFLYKPRNLEFYAVFLCFVCFTFRKIKSLRRTSSEVKMWNEKG